MTSLARVLDELAAAAPLERSDWQDVLARRNDGQVTTARRAGWRRRAVVAVVVSALVLIAAGVALSLGSGLLWQQEQTHRNTPDDPRATGPSVEVASGKGWAIIAWRSEVGLCLDFAVPANASFSCASPVRGAFEKGQPGFETATRKLSGWVSQGGLIGSDGKDTVLGVASSEVARVTIEFPDGQSSEATIVDAPPELGLDVRFFYARLHPPSGHASKEPSSSTPPMLTPPLELTYTAYDSTGAVVDRATGS